MTLACIRRVLCLAGVVLGLAAIDACDLNPQPLPPGETPEGGRTSAGEDAGVSVNGDAAQFGGGDATTGGAPGDAATDAPAVPPGDGSDAGAVDAGESDAPSDAPTDAQDAEPTDAPIDGGEEGGG
jgi:hypothetical protein